jgi:heterotetrameric sarcosine oxidase gamma subunit
MTADSASRELPTRETESLQRALTQRLTTSLAVVTDISDALISGACAAEVLMSGCSLDLHSHAFTVGRIARTSFADIPTIIRKTEEPYDFRCLIDRSFAGHMGGLKAQSGFEDLSIRCTAPNDRCRTTFQPGKFR